MNTFPEAPTWRRRLGKVASALGVAAVLATGLTVVAAEVKRGACPDLSTACAAAQAVDGVAELVVTTLFGGVVPDMVPANSFDPAAPPVG